MVKPITKCDFLKGRLPKYFFLKICSSAGKQTTRKVSAASVVKKCHPRTSLSIVISFVYKDKLWFDENMSVIFCMENT